jgi:hypothetical protein
VFGSRWGFGPRSIVTSQQSSAVRTGTIEICGQQQGRDRRQAPATRRSQRTCDVCIIWIGLVCFQPQFCHGLLARVTPDQVHDIVAGAIIAAEPRMSTELRMKVPHRNICFEVSQFNTIPPSTLVTHTYSLYIKC